MTDWAGLLARRAHRAHPPPERAWHLTMSWLDLLFAHWSFAPETIAALLPPGLQLDVRAGRAWVGVVPFRMENVGPRGLDWLPGVSAFAELNVRTYVLHQDRPGVWFFSLDAASRLAVRAARLVFHLPYHDAEMSCRERDGWIEYRSERRHAGAPPGAFAGRYQPVGAVRPSQPGSLEHWLTERYCLVALDRGGRLRRAEIHHEPWPLQPARAELTACSVAAGWGIPLRGEPETLHFARRIDVLGWLPE